MEAMTDQPAARRRASDSSGRLPSNVSDRRFAAAGGGARGEAAAARQCTQPQGVASTFQRPAGYGPRRADGDLTCNGREMDAEADAGEKKTTGELRRWTGVWFGVGVL
ncbi:hypothetical protein Scep_002621 [Stephania cephalantha]|uniref:Uncharacterized protein n=1 Tax=Stephania cephalantha TaxID=152367 RepID=A0AAP0LD18_9MAGN